MDGSNPQRLGRMSRPGIRVVGISQGIFLQVGTDGYLLDGAMRDLLVSRVLPWLAGNAEEPEEVGELLDILRPPGSGPAGRVRLAGWAAGDHLLPALLDQAGIAHHSDAATPVDVTIGGGDDLDGPNLPVRVLADEVIIGPLTLPGYGPCPRCLDLRVLARRPAEFAEAALSPDRREYARVPPTPGPVIAGLARYLVTLETLRILGGVREPEVLRFNSRSVRLTRHSVLISANCARCGRLEQRPAPPGFGRGPTSGVASWAGPTC